MAVQSTLVFASILFLIVFQIVQSIQSCDLTDMAIKYRNERRFSQRLGRFTMLHTLNVVILSFIYLSIIFTLFQIHFLSENSSTNSVAIFTPAEFSLILTLFIAVFSLINLPTIEITEIDKMTVYREPTDKSVFRRIWGEIRGNLSQDKHVRLCLLILLSPIVPPVLTAVLAVSLGLQNTTMLSIIVILIAVLIVFLLFWLIDGYMVTLRDELLEDVPKSKRRFF